MIVRVLNRVALAPAAALACLALLGEAAAAPRPEAGGERLVIAPRNGPTYDLMGVMLQVKVGKASTHGRLTLVEITVPPGEGIPYHAHLKEDMSYVLVEGSVYFQDDGGIRKVGPGDYVYAAKGVFHELRNLSATPARLVVIYNPGYDESFYREMDRTARLSTGDAGALNQARKAGRSRAVALRPAPRPLTSMPDDKEHSP